MAKRTFIKVKRGLLEAKHVHALGVRYPMYIWLLDRANWELGKILFYRDNDLADEFEMPLRTIREWRRQLEEDKYIVCVQSGNHQEIIINKWTNPRGGADINPIVEDTEGYENMEPFNQESDAFMEPKSSKNMEPLSGSDIEGYIEGSRKHVTLPISDIRHQNTDNSKDLIKMHKTINDYFINECKLQKPRIPSGTYDIGWVEPIIEMMKLTNNNFDMCIRIIDQSIMQADKSKLSITTPKSLLNNFRSEISREARRKKNTESKEFKAEEFLKQ